MLRKIWITLVLSLFVIACGSSSNPGNGQQDAIQPETDGFIQTDTDVASGDQQEVTPNPVNMDFAFVTANGEKGLGQDNVSLTKDDELGAYTGTPGFQLDVHVFVDGLQDGDKVYLVIAGNDFPTPATLHQGSNGKLEATFSNVTLLNSQSGYDVVVESRDAKGVRASVSKHVVVDLGTCGFSILPKTSQCLLTDVDPDTPGIQAVFVISTQDKSCDQAKLTVNMPDGASDSKTVSIGQDGQARFVLTVSKEAKVDNLQIKVVAEVDDSTDPSRNATTPEMTYTVDTTDPVVTITKPAKDSLNLNDDEDSDPSNGLDFTVAGTAEGTNGQPVALEINGKNQSTSSLTSNAFQFKVNLKQDGDYKLRVIARDQCGREGSAEKDVAVHISKANYVMLLPKQGDTLFAKDDQDPSTPKVYDTTFKVGFDNLTPGVQVKIFCQDAIIGTQPSQVGQSAPIVDIPQDGQILINNVRLDTEVFGHDVQCYAMDNAPNPGISSPVRFTVAMPGPMLKIVAPVDGGYVTTNQLYLAIESAFVVGMTPHIVITDKNSGIKVIDEDAPTALQEHGATYSIPLKTQGGEYLPDGIYDLDIDVQDQYGNKASDNPNSLTHVSFILDTTPPTVVINQPAQDIDPTVIPDSDDTMPGFQADVDVAVVSGGGDGTRVCLMVNGDSQRCVNATDNHAIFKATTLIPGINELRAWAVDPAGNKGPEVVQSTTLHLDVPRVTIVSPAQDGPIGAVPFKIKVFVSDQNQAPLKGLTVTLFKNGTKLPDEPLSGPDGFVSFDIQNLSATGDVFIASADNGNGKVGYSAPRRLHLKQGKPTVTFDGIEDGQYINLMSTICEIGYTDCHATLGIKTENVEDGTQVDLKWNCGNGEQDAACTVYNHVCSFTGMVFPDGSTCTLAASLTDAAGITAEVGPVKVIVDRTAPAVYGFVKPNISNLYATGDKDPDKPGYQTQVVVKVAGIEAGQQVVLDVEKAGGASQEYTQNITTDIPQNQPESIDFGLVDLPEGSVKLTVSTRDKAGNTSSKYKRVSVQLSQPYVRFVEPLPTRCQQDSACPKTNMCTDGYCALGWGKGSITSFGIQYLGLYPTKNNIRICSNAPGLTGDECKASGFHAVYYQTAPAQDNAVVLTPDISVFSEGVQSVEVEAIDGSGKWIASINDTSVGPDMRYRTVLVDTTPPKITKLECTSDTEPLGLLNLAEQDNGKYDFHVEASEGGTLVLYKNKDVVALTVNDFSGTGDYQLQLADGNYNVYAVVTDIVGNKSVASAPIPLTVDTIPPTLSFLWPVSNVIKAGESLKVKVSSDAVGQDAILYDNDSEVETKTIGSDNTVEFDYTLTNGDHKIEVKVKDAAGNEASISTQVKVDTQAPSVAIDKPADEAVFNDNNDADPTKPGFQIKIGFTTSGGAVSYAIKSQVGCDQNWENCTDTTDLIPKTALTNPDGQEPDVTVTIPGNEYQVIRVVTYDEVGNEASASVKIRLSLTKCHINLVGLAPNGFIGNADDCGGQDCDNVNHQFIVSLSAACTTPSAVTVYKNGTAFTASDLTGSLIHVEVPVAHGEAFTVYAEADFGGNVIQSSSHNIKIDLHNPVIDLSVADATPGQDGKYLFGVAQDRVAGTPDLQIDLIADVKDDNLKGGYINSIARTVGSDTKEIQPASPAMPYTFTGETEQNVRLNTVTLLDQKDNTLVLTAMDAAGNTATAQIDGYVDLSRPEAVDIQSVDVKNVRQPSVALSWTAIGNVTGYEVRFSRQPIDSDEKFNAACTLDSLLGTGEVPNGNAGSDINFTVTGPDTRAFSDPCSFAPQTDNCKYYFAVRGVDEVGNKGDVSGSTEVDLCMGHKKVTVSGDYSDFTPLWQQAYTIGDVNGDGLSDVAIGGISANLICIIHGLQNPADMVVDQNYADCIAGDDVESGLQKFGTPVVSGDIDGDGVMDLAVGAVKSNKNKTFLFFGVRGGHIASTPNVVISGYNFSSYSNSMAMNADFNGDGHADLIISSQQDNKVYLIPGDPAWKNTSNLSIDLSNSDDLTSHKVTTIALDQSNALHYYFFGFSVGFMKDITGDGMDEAVIRQFGSPGAVYVIKGQAMDTANEIVIPAEWDGSQDQANAVRLRTDSGTRDRFNPYINGENDLGWGPLPDLVLTSYYQTADPLKRIYIFSGDYLANNFGKEVRIDAQTSPVPGVFSNEHGTVIVGNFDSMDVAPSFDGLGRPGLVMTQGNANGATPDGIVYFKSNYKKDGAFEYGTFPVLNMGFYNPYDQTSTDFGFRHLHVIGDFNGDGFYDIIVGRDSRDYQVILF